MRIGFFTTPIKLHNWMDLEDRIIKVINVDAVRQVTRWCKSLDVGLNLAAGETDLVRWLTNDSQITAESILRGCHYHINLTRPTTLQQLVLVTCLSHRIGYETYNMT